MLLFFLARDVWKKKYFEEKKKTPPLEEQSGKLRQEMENLHRKIMSNLEGVRDTHRNEPNKPGPKVSYITCDSYIIIKPYSDDKLNFWKLLLIIC